MNAMSQLQTGCSTDSVLHKLRLETPREWRNRALREIREQPSKPYRFNWTQTPGGAWRIHWKGRRA